MNYPDDIKRHVTHPLSPHFNEPVGCVCDPYEACKVCKNYCNNCTKKDDEGFCPSCKVLI